jgi:hypothetical protein
MIRVLTRGLAAGAAGTTALNAATYLDMAMRGRPPSETPKHSVEEIAQRIDTPIPGDGGARDNRAEGLGALSGIAVGVGVGVIASVLAPLFRRLPLPLGAADVGALAMVAGDAPMVGLGLTDPKEWTAVDWASDALPHLAYGIATTWTVRHI